jgi:hypothetical protein
MEGALNWLLLHVPEVRVPKEMGSIPSASTKSRVLNAKRNMAATKQKNQQKKSSSSAGGGGSGGNRAPKKMTDAQRTIHDVSSLGFDMEETAYFVQTVRKQTRYPDTIKSLFNWCKIPWHHRVETGKLGKKSRFYTILFVLLT